MPFVTVQEFATYLRTSFDEEDAATAAQLLEDAQAVIEGPEGAGQKLESSSDTVVLDGTGTSLLILPRWPVTAIASVTVTEDDETVKALSVETDYRWSENGILTRVDARWPCHPRSVEVVVTAGYAQISQDLKRIQRRLAAGGWYNPAGANSEQSADHSVVWNVPGMELTTSEQRTVKRYAIGNR